MPHFGVVRPFVLKVRFCSLTCCCLSDIGIDIDPRLSPSIQFSVRYSTIGGLSGCMYKGRMLASAGWVIVVFFFFHQIRMPPLKSENLHPWGKSVP